MRDKANNSVRNRAIPCGRNALPNHLVLIFADIRSAMRALHQKRRQGPFAANEPLPATLIINLIQQGQRWVAGSRDLEDATCLRKGLPSDCGVLPIPTLPNSRLPDFCRVLNSQTKIMAPELPGYGEEWASEGLAKPLCHPKRGLHDGRPFHAEGG